MDLSEKSNFDFGFGGGYHLLIRVMTYVIYKNGEISFIFYGFSPITCF